MAEFLEITVGFTTGFIFTRFTLDVYPRWGEWKLGDLAIAVILTLLTAGTLAALTGTLAMTYVQWLGEANGS